MTENFVGAPNIFAKSFTEDKTNISSRAPSPQLDIQIKNQVLHDEKKSTWILSRMCTSLYQKEEVYARLLKLGL